MDDVRREKRAQRLHVAAAGRGEEGGGDCEPALPGDGKARARGPHMLPGAARKLSAGHGVAADRFGDFVEGRAEHVVQEEGGPFQWRQAVERHHQRQGNVVGLVLGGFDHRLGKPRANIGLALPTRRLQVIETDADDDATQIGFRRHDRPAIDFEPAQEGVLNCVLGVRHRAEHAVSRSNETRTQRIEARRRVIRRARRHAALLPSTG